MYKGKELLKVTNLKKHYPVEKNLFGKPKTFVKAVDGVSFSIAPGETLGLVGESGCGKSTLGRCILRLEEANCGSVIFNNEDLYAMSGKELRSARRNMQPIFQDPFASLNPRKTIRQILTDPFEVHKLYNTSERYEQICKLLALVGMRKEHTERYPHEFSGGQRQRIAIARALALNPLLVIADESVSALDVSIQAQILNLMVDLQEQFGLAYLFISHDLSVVRHISDRVAVMYLGKIVEIAPVGLLYSNPRHPYTKALLAAAPIPDPEKKSAKPELQGELPSPLDFTTGCPFFSRCPDKNDLCELYDDAGLKCIDDEHYVSCCGLDF